MASICSGAYDLMEYPIIISNLNDFIFCPASIYFHNLYGSTLSITYQKPAQINGTYTHQAVDTGTYSTRKDILTSLDIYSEKYNLIGKIDIYDQKKKTLIERKRQIKKIYDGYIFQLYAQYFAMIEMGYEVETLKLYSSIDNKTYCVKLPHEDEQMLLKFEQLLLNISKFTLDTFIQNNSEKCRNCIYEPACDRSLI